MPSNEPEYLICLECETPCYEFEWDEVKGKIREARCLACGNENVEEFDTQAGFEGEE
jgi:hypothetical protein